MEKQLTVCYFGNYDPDYSRNRVLITGLRKNGVEVLECNDRSKSFIKYFKLFFKHYKIRKKHQLMIVGFPGHQAMILARFLTRRMIIFDAFLSLYDSLVFDRQIYPPSSLIAKYYWFIDWLSCYLADRILLDTDTHIQYFSQNFRIEKNKFIRIFVSSDSDVFQPLKIVINKDENDFMVHFHGSYIPLQGVDCILEATKILAQQNIHFQIIGSKIKNTYKNKSVFNNVEFIDNVPYEKLPEYINQADICLGVFGAAPKADRVIPNKVYEAIACGKPVITSRSTAIQELFTDRQNILLCQAGHPQDLAEKILELKSDHNLRLKISQNALALFKERLIPEIIVKDLLLAIKH